MTMHWRSRLAILLTAGLLAACGGGGDDGPPPPADDFDAQNAWANFLATVPTRTVSGRGNDGHDYSLRFGVVPVGNANFPVTGVAANRGDLHSTLRIDGILAGTGISELYYDNALQLFGSHDTFDLANPPVTSETCDLASTWSAPPVAARLGTGGPLATTQILDGCAPNAPVIGSATITWSLEWYWGVSYFCVNFDERDNAGQSTLEKDCIDTDPAGNLGLRGLVMLRSPGFAVDMFTP